MGEGGKMWIMWKMWGFGRHKNNNDTECQNMSEYGHVLAVA